WCRDPASLVSAEAMTRLAIIVLAVLMASAAMAQAGAITIVDGDTIKMGGVSYRMLGYDTPETFFARCRQEYDLGTRATARLKQLIAGAKAVTVEPNRRSCRYGRLCARLLVDGRDVGFILIAEGLAVPYDGRGPRRDWCGG